LPIHCEVHSQVLRGITAGLFPITIAAGQRDGVHFVVTPLEHLLALLVLMNEGWDPAL
jgi:hypothetical protein